jgi:hypothetical protein
MTDKTVAYLKALSQYVLGETAENHTNSQDSRSLCELRTSRMKSNVHYMSRINQICNMVCHHVTYT